MNDKKKGDVSSFGKSPYPESQAEIMIRKIQADPSVPEDEKAKRIRILLGWTDARMADDNAKEGSNIGMGLGASGGALLGYLLNKGVNLSSPKALVLIGGLTMLGGGLGNVINNALSSTLSGEANIGGPNKWKNY